MQFEILIPKQSLFFIVKLGYFVVALSMLNISLHPWASAPKQTYLRSLKWGTVHF